MPTPSLAVDERKRRKDAVESALKDGYAPYRSIGGRGSCAAEGARRLSLTRGALESFLRREEDLKAAGKDHYLPDWSLYNPPESVTPEYDEPSRAELHDADFWKRKYTTLSREMGRAEHLIEQLSGLRDIPLVIPDWLLDTRQSKKGKSVVGCLVSDIHMGEVVDAEQILGINAFDPDICRTRLRRYFLAACTTGARWASDTDCEGALVAFAGDLISGDIHEELRTTNALTAHEQVQAVVEECIAGIRHLKTAYGRVHVIGVPGNHGRSTVKPTAKLYARLSYDSLAVSMIATAFDGDDAVTFQSNSATDQITPIFGRTVFTTHGDKIGTRGGMGFAGPDLPIVRGGKKVSEQQASVGWTHNLMQFGHYHWTTNPANGRLLGNGSVPGYTEYGSDIRAAIEPPQQWLYLLHSRWWLRERTPIQLEEPKTPAKPRVTIPAAMKSAA